MEIKPAYHGEALLLRWGDTHNGRTVTLQLDEHFGASHPFKGLKCGPNGQRMQVVCVLIDENEQPVSADNAGRQGAVESTVVKSRENGPKVEASNPPVTPHADQGQASDKPRTFSSLPRSQQAALKCQDEDFIEWINAVDDSSADAILKRRLGIKSKTELDIEGPKAEAFDRLMTDFSVRGIIR